MGSLDTRLCACGCGAALVGRRSHTRYHSASCRKRGERNRSTVPRQERGWNLEAAAIRRELDRQGLLGDLSQRQPGYNRRRKYYGSAPPSLEIYDSVYERATELLHAKFVERRVDEPWPPLVRFDTSNDPLATRTDSAGAVSKSVAYQYVERTTEELNVNELLDRLNVLESRLALEARQRESRQADALNLIQWNLTLIREAIESGALDGTAP